VLEEAETSLTVRDLAERVNISPNHLGDLFTAETGLSLKSYCTTVRMARAKAMLDTEHVRIFELAVRLGYESSEYFCKVFKTHFGLSPAEYRNRNSPR
jgi:two-component system, response regulator YesN